MLHFRCWSRALFKIWARAATQWHHWYCRDEEWDFGKASLHRLSVAKSKLTSVMYLLGTDYPIRFHAENNMLCRESRNFALDLKLASKIKWNPPNTSYTTQCVRVCEVDVLYNEVLSWLESHCHTNLTVISLVSNGADSQRFHLNDLTWPRWYTVCFTKACRWCHDYISILA